MDNLLPKTSATTKGYSGNLDLPEDPNRGYFFIVMTTGEGTIQFGEDGGLIPLAEGFHYAPPAVPVTTIHVVTTGEFTLHMNNHP